VRFRVVRAASAAGIEPSARVGTGPFTGAAPAAIKTASPGLAARKDATRRSLGRARIVELILAKAPDSDRLYLAQAQRREMGKAKIVFRTVEPKPLETDPNANRPPSFTPAQLAEAIRKAVEHGASGLIVEPLEDPAVLDALYEADGRGVAVLLLDRPVAPRAGKSLHTIRYASFAEPGRQIVQTTLDAAKLLGRQQGGRILILHNRSADPYATERLKSLVDPVTAAGKSADVIEFEADSGRGVAALQSSLAADPKVAIVLADDDQGMSVCLRVLSELRNASRPEFLVGGYLAYDYRTASDAMGQAVAFADRSVESFATKTFQTMLSLLDGKPVGERVEVPIIVHKKPTIFVPTPQKAGGP